MNKDWKSPDIVIGDAAKGSGFLFVFIFISPFFINVLG